MTYALRATRTLASDGLTDAPGNAASVKSRFEDLAASVNKESVPAANAGAFAVSKPSILGLEFTPRPGISIPADQNELRIRIGRVLTVLQILFETRPRRLMWLWRRPRSCGSSAGGDTLPNKRAMEYGDQLYGIAKLGLENNPAQVKPAAQQLEEFQTQIVAREAGKIKNAYMQRLLAYALGAVALFLAAFFALSTRSADSVFAPLVPYENVLLLLGGASFGAWLSFGMRKVVLSFGDLAALEEDRLDPPIRLVFVCGLAVIITLLFVTGAVSIAIGSFITKPLESIPAALLIGLFCGISEQGLALTVGKRASEFISGVAPSGAPSAAPSR